jgi:serine protease Do
MTATISSDIAAGPRATHLLSEAAAAIVERVGGAVVVVGTRGGAGAGVVWREDGLIVTNRHVAHRDRQQITLRDGRQFEGQVVDRHPDRDLATIKIEATGLPTAIAGDSATVRPGELIFAIGHPIGFRDAVTSGIIVAAGQAITAEGPRTGDWLQADVTLLPGNSGGPLVDVHGRVIGISTMIAGRLSLAVPSNTVEAFVAGGRYGARQAYLGLGGFVVDLRGQPQPVGFIVTEVTTGSPADRAGLLVGDVITRVGEYDISDQESLPAATLRLVPGNAVTVEIVRGGEARAFTIVPATRP